MARAGIVRARVAAMGAMGSGVEKEGSGYERNVTFIV